MLSAADLETFARLRIPAEMLESTGIERVTDDQARAKYGLTGHGDFSGVCFPYFDPISGYRWTARIRRDNPEVEDNKVRRKYMSPHGDRRHLYFVRGTAGLLRDVSVPIILVEAEKSALGILAWAVTWRCIMLTIYRRHRKSCEHRNEGRAYRRCHCPIWVDGFLGRTEIRESMKLRDWTKAQQRVSDWEAKGSREEEDDSEGPVTVAHAGAEFLRDARARGLRRPTLYKYRLLLRRLRDFSEQRGLRYIAELGLGHVRAFRAAWPDHNLAALKKLERLRAFLRFCVDSGWIADNAAGKLKNPKITEPPTLPLSREEVANIITACGDYPDRANSVRLRALVLLLRFSGLRIRDAVTLSRDRVHDGKLFLYTAKTGTAVWCPLPPAVIEALDAIPTRGKYFFWTGESNPKSCVGDWQRSLRRLARLAGVPSAHAHRFRDTFAVELLLSGVPLERVSMLLGHQSVKVTEKHYSPWVRARQEQLEQDVRRTWDADLLACGETKGTFEVHGQSSRPN